MGKYSNIVSNVSANVAADVNITDAGSIITATEVEGALQENRTAINLNTAKSTNVSTNLSEGTASETTVDVNSSDGTNATLVSASTSRAGLLTKAKFDEIAANTAKVSDINHNVPTALSVGTVGVSTVGITSDGGVDDVILPAATNTVAGVVTAAQITTLESRAASGANADITSMTNVDVGGIPQSAIANSYGVAWDESADTYSRTGSLAGQATSQTLSDALLPIHASMRRCILNDAGELQYYLNVNNSAFKANGVTASDLTGGDGQVMVQIAKFFYRYFYTGTTHTWEVSLTPAAGFSVHPAFIKNGEVVDYRYMGAYEGIGWDASVAAYIDSDCNAATNWSGTTIDLVNDKLGSVSGLCPMTAETRAEFRAIAANRGVGWRQLDFDLVSAAILMYITEYADWNSQAMIGAGRTTLSGGSSVKDSYIGTTGLSNSDGNGTNSVSNGTTAGFLTDYMTYRGIENLFGNSWTWVDGINLNKVSNVYVCNTDTDFADGTATGYTDLGITIAPVGGWQKYMTQQPRGFLSSSAGGSSTTYITDYYSRPAGWCVMALGGHSIDGAYAGIADCNMIQTSSYASASFGSRLAY